MLKHRAVKVCIIIEVVIHFEFFFMSLFYCIGKHLSNVCLAGKKVHTCPLAYNF